MYAAGRPAQKFCRCALVGNSEKLRNQRLGSFIDMHDTVIRVNRLPLEEHFADFGKKTDIFFADPGHGFDEEDAKFFSDGAGGEYTLQGFTYKRNETQPAKFKCSLSLGGVGRGLDGSVAAPCDRFSTLIMKGSEKGPFRQRFPLNEPGWEPGLTAFPVGHQSDELHDAVRSMLGGKEPSSGLHAFLTFAPLCGSISLFGFEGEGNYDGQTVDPDLSFDEEHEVLETLMKGSIANLKLRDYSPRVELQSLSSRGCIMKGNSKEAAMALKEETVAQVVVPEQEVLVDQRSKEVCFFVRSTTISDKGIERINAVSSTWAANPALGSKVFYVVDQPQGSYELKNSIASWQIIETPSFKYQDLPFRDRYIIDQLNSTNLRQDCRWMALVDDDVYVNTAMVVEQFRWVSSSNPYIIAPAISSRLFQASLAYTGFKLFSEASLPVLADALQTCELPTMEAEEIDVIRCLQKLRLQSAVAFDQLSSKLSVDYPRQEDGEAAGTFDPDLSKKGCNAAMIMHKLEPQDMITYHEMISHVPLCFQEIETIPY